MQTVYRGETIYSISPQRFMKIALIFCALATGVFAPGTLSALENPYRVKAAFLRNFARYVDWPAAAFPDAEAPFTVCVLGPDPFGGILEDTLHGRREHGRGFLILHLSDSADARVCHIAYLTYEDRGKILRVLASVKDRPVLTVGDNAGFLSEGGVIRFDVADKVAMSINLDQASAVALRIRTKMLEVSREVLTNGEFRQIR
jgi:hypothetical protein